MLPRSQTRRSAAQVPSARDRTNAIDPATCCRTWLLLADPVLLPRPATLAHWSSITSAPVQASSSDPGPPGKGPTTPSFPTCDNPRVGVAARSRGVQRNFHWQPAVAALPRCHWRSGRSGTRGRPPIVNDGSFTCWAITAPAPPRCSSDDLNAPVVGLVFHGWASTLRTWRLGVFRFGQSLDATHAFLPATPLTIFNQFLG